MQKKQTSSETFLTKIFTDITTSQFLLKQGFQFLVKSRTEEPSSSVPVAVFSSFLNTMNLINDL